MRKIVLGDFTIEVKEVATEFVVTAIKNDHVVATMPCKTAQEVEDYIEYCKIVLEN